MKREQVKTLAVGERVEDFFLLKSGSAKQTRQTPPKEFLDLTLGDQSGTINAKLWDCSETDKQNFDACANEVVKIRGTVTSFKETLQINVERIRFATTEDNVTIHEFIPVAPIPAQDMIDQIYAYIHSIEHDHIKRIVQLIVQENESDLMKYPAAKKMHHAVYSGLAYHILCMLHLADSLCKLYPTLNRDLLLGGVILHDLGKIEEFEDEFCSDYSLKGKLIGHIPMMSNLIHQKSMELDIQDSEVVTLLQHMALSHHGLLEYGSPIRPQIKEAEILHHIDMIDANMFAMDEAIAQSSSEATFTDPIGALDRRRLYKHDLK